MEIASNLSQSTIYMQLAQKRAELANAEKEDFQKDTQNAYDELNSSDNKYDEKDYERVLSKFKDLDAQTRAHEQAHAAGATTTSPIQYNYQVGPDGKLYATGGSVRLDTSIPEDEAGANYKLAQLQRASSAPGELSSADAQIARTANLNRLLLQSQEQNSLEKGVNNANY